VLLDIDTEGEDPFGGLAVLKELRRLNEELTLISISRGSARSVEKQALGAGLTHTSAVRSMCLNCA